MYHIDRKTYYSIVILVEVVWGHIYILMFRLIIENTMCMLIIYNNNNTYVVTLQFKHF